MEQILCVIDFSSAAPVVLSVAVKIAKSLGKPVTVLYPYRILPGKGPITEYRKTVLQQAQEAFAALEQKLHLNGSVGCEFRAEIGFINDRVESYFQQHRVSMVVLSEKMAFEKNEAGFTNMQELLKRVPVPVVVVPEKQSITT